MRSSRGEARGWTSSRVARAKSWRWSERVRPHGQEALMYRWIVFIHIASVLGLLLVHPVTVAFHLKQERNDTRIRELLEVSEAASTLRWIFFGLTIASGIVLGFMGDWWGTA